MSGENRSRGNSYESKLLPEIAYPNLYFPESLETFSKAVKSIVDGWNAIVGG